jgi:hypothetical protein
VAGSYLRKKIASSRQVKECQPRDILEDLIELRRIANSVRQHFKILPDGEKKFSTAVLNSPVGSALSIAPSVAGQSG